MLYVCHRPNGRLDAILTIPDEPMCWVLGGFAISKDKGFGIIKYPPRVSVFRFSSSVVRIIHVACRGAAEMREKGISL